MKTTEPTNDERAEWAYAALERFAHKTGQDESGDLQHDREWVLSDLLADLMHLCDRDGMDFNRCLVRGQTHYKGESEKRKPLTKKHEPIPKDWPVRPLKNGQNAKDKCTCGHCGLSWDDGKVTSMTPTPSARCPFESFHLG